MDPERLAEIYVEMGEAKAEIAVARATDDLIVTLERLRGLQRIGRLDGLSRSAARIAMIAEPLGLSSLARAAQNVSDVAAKDDLVALNATLARLERMTDQSVRFVTDLRDLSG